MVEHSVHTRSVICSSQIAATIRPVGQAVKTPPFHGGNMGSIPVRVTKKKRSSSDGRFFLCSYAEASTSFECKHFPIEDGRCASTAAFALQKKMCSITERRSRGVFPYGYQRSCLPAHGRMWASAPTPFLHLDHGPPAGADPWSKPASLSASQQSTFCVGPKKIPSTERCLVFSVLTETLPASAPYR